MVAYFLNPEILVRPRGVVRHNDIICPQAFGRNTWTDNEVAEKLNQLFDEGPAPWQKLDDLQRFRKLDSAGFDPGDVNRQLAKICYGLSFEAGNTWPQAIVGQWEVLYAVYQMDTTWYESFWSCHHAIWPPNDGCYLTTRGLLHEVHNKISPAKQVIVIGQAVHLARCVRLADKIFGKERVIVPTPPTPLYDTQSVQPWTRDKTSFLEWEKKARVFEELPLFLRNIVREKIQK